MLRNLARYAGIKSDLPVREWAGCGTAFSSGLGRKWMGHYVGDKAGLPVYETAECLAGGGTAGAGAVGLALAHYVGQKADLPVYERACCLGVSSSSRSSSSSSSSKPSSSSSVLSSSSSAAPSSSVRSRSSSSRAPQVGGACCPPGTTWPFAAVITFTGGCMDGQTYTLPLVSTFPQYHAIVNLPLACMCASGQAAIDWACGSFSICCWDSFGGNCGPGCPALTGSISNVVFVCPDGVSPFVWEADIVCFSVTTHVTITEP